jgi:signal transduction histidine kinase
MPREYCYVSNDKQLIKAINTELDKMEDEGVIDEVYGGVKSTFGEMAIPLWVWLVMGGLAIVGLGATVVVQSRGRKRLMEEVERAHQSEVRARESEERARKSEELKGIFLNNVSHALRTPLNAIIGFSDLMLSDEKDEIKLDERRNLLGLINTNGLQLLHLINELLNLSDIEGKEKFFNMEVTDIVAEFDKYVSEIRPQLHPGVELIVNEPVDGIRAMVDRRFMRMVNMHLLENAMQHTTEGKITLSYYVKQGGIYAEVRDTGTGLPPQLKENIFALLNDKNTYLQDEMPGLGLSICKAICDKMGGQIGARDNDIDGRGTIIWTWAEVELV